MASRERRWSRRGFIGTAAGVAVGAASGWAPRVLAEGSQDALAKPALALSDLKTSGPLDEAYWWKVRSQFNIVDGMTFMNNGTEGPVPRVVTEANERVFREIAEDPSNNYRREEVDVVRGADRRSSSARPLTKSRSPAAPPRG